VGVEIMIGDTAALDGSGSGEGKPKARVKVAGVLTHSGAFARGPNQAAYFGPESRENGLYQ
jgi:hypothetical protein